MLTDVAGINEPLSRVKTKERSGCRCGYCFHGYKDVSFVAKMALVVYSRSFMPSSASRVLGKRAWASWRRGASEG